MFTYHDLDVYNRGDKIVNYDVSPSFRGTRVFGYELAEFQVEARSPL